MEKNIFGRPFGETRLSAPQNLEENKQNIFTIDFKAEEDIEMDWESKRMQKMKLKTQHHFQQKSRDRILALQKEGRESMIKKARGLIELTESEEAEDKSEGADNIKNEAALAKKQDKAKKNHWVRKGYSVKVLLFDFMLELPEDAVRNWYIYNKPEGQRCLIYTLNNKTVMRDKNGYVLKEFKSFLPSGSTSVVAKNKGKCMVQGIYSEITNTIYLIDVLIWADALQVDSSVSLRQFWLHSKVNELDADISKVASNNEIQMKLLNCHNCSVQNLETLYHGLYYEFKIYQSQNCDITIENVMSVENDFSKKITQMLKFVSDYNFWELLKIHPAANLDEEILRRLCAGLGVDKNEDIYLKDGIAFIYQEAMYTFGASPFYLQWKDPYSSPYFTIGEAEMDEGKIATVLHLNRKKEMETQEGTVLLKECAYAIERLSNYKFTFDSINTEEGNEELLGLEFVGISSRMAADTWSAICFRYRAKYDPFTFESLASALNQQEKAHRQEVLQEIQE